VQRTQSFARAWGVPTHIPLVFPTNVSSDHTENRSAEDAVLCRGVGCPHILTRVGFLDDRTKMMDMHLLRGKARLRQHPNCRQCSSCMRFWSSFVSFAKTYPCKVPTFPCYFPPMSYRITRKTGVQRTQSFAGAWGVPTFPFISHQCPIGSLRVYP
jgi:hypothetical protein